jgi:D-alanyl-D-alanine carboxypeptidase/D-alanyl-D-alanine-endopeptidase (penicillin-binding protein 4)
VHGRDVASDPAAGLRGCLGTLVTARHCRWGIVVRDGITGRGLYHHNAQLMFNPASNIKLITTSAALHRLGPGFRFTTEVFGRVDRGRVVGGLYLRGNGDPTLTGGDLAEIAATLRRLGIREVVGPIYLDDTAFDCATDPPGFRRFRSSHPFRAGVGALSLNHNVVRITITPGQRPGEPASVELSPSSGYLVPHGTIWTTTRPSRFRVATHSRLRWTGVNTTGRIRIRSRPRRYWRRIFQPVLYTGHTFLSRLEAQGVRVTRHRTLRRRKVPPGMPLLVAHRSPRLETIIYNGNKRSSNLVAEHLLLALGADLYGPPATYEKGRAALARYLERFGVQPGTYFLENGSGLSRRSRMRPVDLVTVLEGIFHDFAVGPEIQSSLPMAGRDGTLRRRFRGTSAEGVIRAKTGTLSGTLCLTGYAANRDRLLFFSFLAARVRRIPSVRWLQVKMSECLTGYLRRVDP